MTQLTCTPIDIGNVTPKLIVTVDTEEQFDWTRFDPESYSLADVADIDKFQTLCQEENVVPLYFLSYPLIIDEKTATYYRDKQSMGHAACGLHLHPWVTPPHSALRGEYYSYQMNYPQGEHRAKLAALADAYEGVFGARATSHRAGRYGIAPDNYQFLAEVGISHDFSLSPSFDFSPSSGPDFSGTSNKAFHTQTAHGPVSVTPVSGARALRHTKIFRSQELNPAGFAAPHKRARFTEPVRISPEASDLETLKALTKHLINDGVFTLTFTIHSTSLTIGATDYSPDQAAVDSMLKTTAEYFQWFRQFTGGDIVSLNELTKLYTKEATTAHP